MNNKRHRERDGEILGMKEIAQQRQQWQGEEKYNGRQTVGCGGGKEIVQKFIRGILKCPNSSPAGCSQDSHRCSLLQWVGQRETAQYLRTRGEISAKCVSDTHSHSNETGGKEEEVGADSLQQPQRLSWPTSFSGSRQGPEMDGTGKAVEKENAGRLTAIRNVFLSP